MPNYDKRLDAHRAAWERALRDARCDKCGAKLLEVDMPNVACSKCSTQYILAIEARSKMYNLIEKGHEERVMTCPFCNGSYDETRFYNCPHCGKHAPPPPPPS